MSSGTVRLTAAQALVRHLARQWSERDGQRRRAIPALFGIFGHGNVCGLGPALEEDGGRELRFLQPKNEQASVHAAIGFARSSDLLATLACTASVGPGSTNLVTGAATATVNRVPVLLLPADGFAHRRGDPVMQALEHPREADLSVNDALRPVSAYFDRITRPEQLLRSLPEAMRVLLDPEETGAVTLSLCQDVQGEAYDFPLAFFEPRTWRVSRRPPAAAELSAAVEALRAGERPLLIAGGGVHYSGALPELAELSERLGVPVAETSAGKGALPGGALAVGGIGVTGSRAANALAREADLIVSAGSAHALGFCGSAVELRDRLLFALQAEGVAASLWQLLPLPSQPVFRRGRFASWRPGDDREPLLPWDPQAHPRAARLLESSFVIGTADEPLFCQPCDLMQRYVEAFEKVIGGIETVLAADYVPVQPWPPDER